MLVIGRSALMINGHAALHNYLPHISIETWPFGPATRRIQPRSHDAGLSHGADGQEALPWASMVRLSDGVVPARHFV